MTSKSNKIKVWLGSVRPKTLLASLSPVLVGGAYAWAQGISNWPVWILTAVTAMLLQIIANLANDFFDYKHGFDIPGSQGALRIMQTGLIKPQTFTFVTSMLSFLTVLSGSVLVWLSGWPILIIGVASLAFAFLYSAGPWPLSSHAMGEVAAVFFFGLVAGGGTYFLQTNDISVTVLALSLIPGFLNACIMMANNYRDLNSDRQSGKITLFSLTGRNWARRIYAASIIAAYVIILLVVIVIHEVSYWTLLAFLSLPLGLKVTHDIYTKNGSILNTTVVQTALLNFCTSLLLIVGLQFDNLISRFA